MKFRYFLIALASVLIFMTSCSDNGSVNGQITETVTTSDSVCEKLSYWVEKVEEETWNLDYTPDYQVPGFFFFGMKEDLESAGFTVPEKSSGSYDDEIATFINVARTCLSAGAIIVLENSLSSFFEE